MPTHLHSTQSLIKKIQSLPADRIAEVEDFVDFLKERTHHRKTTFKDKELLDFPVIRVGKWPENFSLRREDMYGDNGR